MVIRLFLFPFIGSCWFVSLSIRVCLRIFAWFQLRRIGRSASPWFTPSWLRLSSTSTSCALYLECRCRSQWDCSMINRMTMRMFMRMIMRMLIVHLKEFSKLSPFPVSSANLVHQGARWNLQGGIVWYFNNIFLSLTFSTHGRYTLVGCFACTTNIKLLIKLRHHNMMTSYSRSFHR